MRDDCFRELFCFPERPNRISVPHLYSATLDATTCDWCTRNKPEAAFRSSNLTLLFSGLNTLQTLGTEKTFGRIFTTKVKGATSRRGDLMA